MKKRGRDNTTRVSAFWKGEKAIGSPHCACAVGAVVVDLRFLGEGGVYNTLCRRSCADPGWEQRVIRLLILHSITVLSFFAVPPLLLSPTEPLS